MGCHLVRPPIDRRRFLAYASVMPLLGAGHHALAGQLELATQSATDVPAIDVRKHGAIGDGVANDRRAIQRVLDNFVTGGGVVTFPPGTYNLGDCAQETLLRLSGARGIRLIGRGATLICNSVTKSVSRIFDVIGCSNITFEGLSFRDTGLDIDVTWKGAIAIALTSTDTSATRDIRIIDVKCNSVLSGVTCTTPGLRTSNIHIRNLRLLNSYYGISCQNNGDRLVAEDVVCENLRRSYFVYGCSDHVASIASINNVTGSNDVIIHSSTRDTADIDLTVVSRGKTHGEAIIQLSHETVAGGRMIRNVRLKLDIETSARRLPYAVAFWHRNQGERKFEEITKNRWDGIALRGRIITGPDTVPVAVLSRPEISGTLEIASDFFTSSSNLRLEGFKVSQPKGKSV